MHAGPVLEGAFKQEAPPLRMPPAPSDTHTPGFSLDLCIGPVQLVLFRGLVD